MSIRLIEMGRLTSDDRDVVVSKFKVNGVERLKVVDPSVMTQINSVNPNTAPSIIGMKSAPAILAE